MSENPFAAPNSPAGPPEESKNDQLVLIARRQRRMLLAAIAHLLAIVLFVVANIEVGPMGHFVQYSPAAVPRVTLATLAIICIATFVMMLIGMVNSALTTLLGTQVFSKPVGKVCGLIAALPLVGLLSTFIVSRKATMILRSQDIRVGLFGANLSDLRRRADEE